jgi:hypothetical protein
MCQHRAEDVLSAVVPRHGSHGWPMSSYMSVDPLGDQAIRRPGLFSGCGGKDILGEFSR